MTKGELDVARAVFEARSPCAASPVAADLCWGDLVRFLDGDGPDYGNHGDLNDLAVEAVRRCREEFTCR